MQDVFCGFFCDDCSEVLELLQFIEGHVAIEMSVTAIMNSTLMGDKLQYSSNDLGINITDFQNRPPLFCYFVMLNIIIR